MTLMQTHHFCVCKALLANTLICLIILISCIMRLHLILKLNRFRPGPHISFEYAQNNDLSCPMMEEVSFET